MGPVAQCGCTQWSPAAVLRHEGDELLHRSLWRLKSPWCDRFANLGPCVGSAPRAAQVYVDGWSEETRRSCVNFSNTTPLLSRHLFQFRKFTMNCSALKISSQIYSLPEYLCSIQYILYMYSCFVLK